MQTLFLLFALLAVSLADNPKCPCTVEDNYLLKGTFFGSTCPGGNRTGFRSLVGTYEEAMYHDTTTPTNSLLMINATIIATDGTTGKCVATGWSWTLGTKTGLYHMSSINGVVKPCKRHNTVPIPKLSDIITGLNKIYPPTPPCTIIPPTPPTTPPTTPPPETIICQGTYPKTDVVLTMGFAKEGNSGVPQMTFSSSVTPKTRVTTRGIEIRPLQVRDDIIFANPCKEADSTNKHERLHLSLYHSFKELLPMMDE